MAYWWLYAVPLEREAESHYSWPEVCSTPAVFWCFEFCLASEPVALLPPLLCCLKKKKREKRKKKKLNKHNAQQTGMEMLVWVPLSLTQRLETKRN